jgi:NAD-dependent dihydropyrimidine dehydrogenase PreA subunit
LRIVDTIVLLGIIWDAGFLVCALGPELKKQKQEIITFKVPESLRVAMKGIPNRSEFIRHAVMTALDSVCPLCRGTGVLLPHQKNHWDHFAVDHRLEECDSCHAMHLVCAHKSSRLIALDGEADNEDKLLNEK